MCVGGGDEREYQKVSWYVCTIQNINQYFVTLFTLAKILESATFLFLISLTSISNGVGFTSCVVCFTSNSTIP